MYKTIKRRFELGNIKLVTVINTLGTTISLFIVLWIYYFMTDTKLNYNARNLCQQFGQNFGQHFNTELFRGVTSHGPMTSIITTLYLLKEHNEKIRYLLLSYGSLWLLFTTKSIWPSLFLGCCLGMFHQEDQGHPSFSRQFPDL
jgi:hypothetical protein